MCVIVTYGLRFKSFSLLERPNDLLETTVVECYHADETIRPLSAVTSDASTFSLVFLDFDLFSRLQKDSTSSM